MHKIIQLDDEYMYGNTIISELILELKRGFATQSIMFPMRNHHDLPCPEIGIEITINANWDLGIGEVIDIVTFKS